MKKKIIYLLFSFASVLLFPQGSWQYVGFSGTHISDMVISKDSTSIFAVGGSDGLYRSMDGSSSWQKILNNHTYHLYIHTNGYLFAGTNQGVLRSTDNGNTWVPVNNNIPGIEIRAITGDSTNNIFACPWWSNSAVYRTTNFGGLWFQTHSSSLVLRSRILKLTSTGTLFAGVMTNSIMKSTNLGSTWGFSSTGIYSDDIADIDEAKNGYILASVSGDSAGLYYSTNNGSNWTRSFWGYTSKMNVTENGTIFIAAFSSGIIKSEDNGLSFSYLPHLGDFAVSVVHDPLNNLLFAATYNTGVFKMDYVIPVDLISFSAVSYGGNILVQWKTATESNNLGFSLERKDIGTWEEITFISGKGTTSEITNYSFIDSNLAEDKYSYRLKQIDYDGSYKYSNEIEVERNNSIYFHLSQNYPNPFNAQTKIRYSIPSGDHVLLKIYDVLGREVAQLVNEFKAAGTYETDFNADHLSSGIYFYRLSAGKNLQTKKLLLLK